jgi:hypothetical protein
MFVSTQTDETNPAALAIGAGVGALVVLLVGVVMFLKREAWFKWTSAKLANVQPLIQQLVVMAAQIAVFALMVRSLDDAVAWVWLYDGSWVNPSIVCMARSKTALVPCTTYPINTICGYQYHCNGLAAPEATGIFIILACVASWIVLVAEVGLAVPQIPLEPRLGASIAIFGVFLQIIFVWLSLWVYGGYLISYFSGLGFPIADEGVIVILVTLPLFVPLAIITSAQMTLHTK